MIWSLIMDMNYYYYDDMDYDLSAEDVAEDYDIYQQHLIHETPRLMHETQSVSEAYKTCARPSIEQISGYICSLIAWSLLCRFVWTCCRRSKNDWLQHLTSLLCGFGALYFITGFDFFIVLFLALLTYTLMLLLAYNDCQCIGTVVAVLSVCAHFAYEMLWHKPEAWHRIRGIQMVATMKIISLAFDLETANKENKEERKTIPALVHFLGYIFCPGTCVLGPWIPYSSYLNSIHTARVTNFIGFRWFIWSVLNLAFAVAFLCLSNCLVPLLCSEKSWKWVILYRDALSVRCSHYFICFLSQATLSTNGVSTHSSPSRFIQAEKPHALFGYLVTCPLRIEMPRSLSSLVRCWNIPMHEWLKTYVFRAAQQKFSGNYVAAILSTYLVSSLLHGLHTRIYLVLLSLGIFSYVESVLRSKLANIFDACIAANPCRQAACSYTYCPNRNWRKGSTLAVIIVNLCFSLVVMFHLAYLGIMLSAISDNGERETMAYLLSKWSDLNYLSHWIVLFTYLFYYVI